MKDMPERICAYSSEHGSPGNGSTFHASWHNVADPGYLPVGRNEAEYVRADLVAEKDARIERLRKALEQACDRADLVAASDTDEGYCELNQRLPVWEHRHKELAAYLREREGKS